MKNAKCSSLFWSSRCVHTDWLRDYYGKVWGRARGHGRADQTLVVAIQQKKEEREKKNNEKHRGDKHRVCE